MSSLIFYTDAVQALVATDTLAVALDGSPMMFCSKATYIPHLRLIIAGTGLGMFSLDWAAKVSTRMIVAGILNLDYHASKQLPDLWERAINENSLPPTFTTTVYHFGISEEDQTIQAFAYRSTNGFRSERLSYGMGAKPECTQRTGILTEIIPDMMREQRAIQESKAVTERLYIGGECIAMHLSKSGCNIWSLFQFDDYSNQLQQIFANYVSKNS